MNGVFLARSSRVWRPVAQSFVQHNGGIQVENDDIEWFIWLHRNNEACQMSRMGRDEQPVMTYQVEI